LVSKLPRTGVVWSLLDLSVTSRTGIVRSLPDLSGTGQFLDQNFITSQVHVLSSQSSFALLAVLKPNRIIHKCTDANCNSFHLRVLLGLSNPQGQRQTSTLSIPHDNFGERKAKFNIRMSMTTQM
jgi:hypothetical protein